jgi:hypothetical protein
MTNIKQELEEILDCTAGTVKEVVTDGSGLVHRLGVAIEAADDDVANAAGEELETVGRQMKDTTKHAPSPGE